MSLILTMCLFSLSMSISPGPVNMLTLSTGASHGFRKALPFVTGGAAGFTLLLLLIGLGIAEVASRNAEFLRVLAVIGSGYIVYLGYCVASAKPNIEIESKSRPGWLQGALLQWLNPKAWTACLAGVSLFNLTDSLSMLLLFVGLYFVICYASIASWALIGARMQNLLSSRAKVRFFNVLMGGMLIAVAIYLLVLQF